MIRGVVFFISSCSQQFMENLLGRILRKLNNLHHFMDFI